MSKHIYQELNCETRRTKEPLAKKASLDGFTGFVTNFFSGTKSSPGKHSEVKDRIDKPLQNIDHEIQVPSHVETSHINPWNKKTEIETKLKDSSTKSKSSIKEKDGISLMKRFSIKNSSKNFRQYKSQRDLLIQDHHHDPSCSIWKWLSNEALTSHSEFTSETTPLCKKNVITIVPASNNINYDFPKKIFSNCNKSLLKHKRAKSFDLQVLFENEELVITPMSYSLEDVCNLEKNDLKNDGLEVLHFEPTESLSISRSTEKATADQSKTKSRGKDKKCDVRRANSNPTAKLQKSSSLMKQNFNYSVGQSCFLNDFSLQSLNNIDDINESNIFHIDESTISEPQIPKILSLFTNYSKEIPLDSSQCYEIVKCPGINATTSPNSPNLPSPLKSNDARILFEQGGGALQMAYKSFDATQQNKEKTGIAKLLGIFQATQDSKMDELAKQLNLYSRCGIPKLPHLLACQSMSEDHELKIEDGWRCIVSSAPNLTEHEEKHQSAIWELVETEATYISMLKVITDLFLACLCNLQNERILNEIDTDRLFNNIQDIYQANLEFWRNHVFPVLEETRRTNKPLDPTPLLDGFYKFEQIFQPYTQYCLEQSNCQNYCKYHARENNYFKAYLAWCETQKECNRLKLVDILVQPMQRLTKYSLLLKAIHKKTQDENHKSCLLEMVCIVDRFVSTVNSALRNRYEQERLREIIKKIESYDAVEARDDELAAAIKHHSELNLLQPMPGCPQHFPRWLLFQGDFRFRDAQTSKIDVHIYLFTDLLLITKITQRKNDKVKVVRPPFRIDRLVIVELKDSSTIGFINLTDWGVASAAFSLQSNDAKVNKLLLDGIASARKQFQDAKFSRERPPFEIDEDASSHLPRSPRLGSSRASRVSSLAHSHSGSMDLNEASTYASPGSHHPPSVDLSEIRASSASSEDSVSGHQSEIQRSKSLEGQHSSNSSNRRIAFPKTPNTLSVTPPYATGQSLPNLSSDPTHCLKVPTHKQLSPSNRGISYPPPSPRTLRRCPPVPQSRNPPLLKTRHVTSVASQPQEAAAHEGEDQEEGRRRLSRVDRLDNRRYHTAGAIDDLKKQDTKDTTIHKRLSLNYGQAPPVPPPRQDISEEPSRLLSKHKSAGKSISSESVHSSSGVSSTSSLLRAEYEALENIDDDNEFEEGDSTVVDLSVNDCSGLKVSPHISTTYICHDSEDITLGVSASQYITQPLDDSHTLTDKATTPGTKIGVPKNESDCKVSSVQITVIEEESKNLSTSALLQRSSSSYSSSSSSFSSTSSSTASSNSSSSNSAHSKIPKDDKMREILLNDANIEASDV